MLRAWLESGRGEVGYDDTITPWEPGNTVWGPEWGWKFFGKNLGKWKSCLRIGQPWFSQKVQSPPPLSANESDSHSPPPAANANTNENDSHSRAGELS